MKERKPKMLSYKGIKIKKYITTEEDYARAEVRRKIEIYEELRELKRMNDIDYH